MVYLTVYIWKPSKGTCNMATVTSDSDVERDNGNVGEGRGSKLPETNPTEGSEATDNRPEVPSSHSRRQTERTSRITETHTENIQGLDELTSCINSVDDHVQAGLQELRNCVANLKKERTDMYEKVRTLTEEAHQISVERDHYRLAIEELQQEVSTLREQLYNHQQDKDALQRRMQQIQQRNDNHLVNIAAKQRSRRVAHSAIVRWRKKALDKRFGDRENVLLLEEENNQLRAELLLCQEAAKQAFLRSANALNSEALTMFQDAATRRLGFEETSSNESEPSHPSSPPDSPGRHLRTSQENFSAVHRAPNEDKENLGGYREGTTTTGTHGWRGRSGHEGAYESDDNRSYIATYGSEDQNANVNHRNHSADVYRRGNYGEQEGCGVYGHGSVAQDPSNSRLMGSSRYVPSSEEPSAVGGKLPSMKRPPPVVEFEPNVLQQETRAYLQQLREERRRRPDPNHATESGSQRKNQKTTTSHSDSRRKTCSCRSLGKGAATVNAGPYKCPYCTPVQNSSFGHAKEVLKKCSNATRNTLLSNTNTDKKKVLYKPSASTILIEKHITR